MRRANLYLREMIAIIPYYDEQGSGSRVVLTDGSERMDARAPQTIMKRALEQHGLDLRTYRKAHADNHYGKQFVPIVYRGLAFMTCQMVKPRIAGDETYGFARTDAIMQIVSAGNGAAILLCSGLRIETMQKLKTVQHHFDRAIGLLYQVEKGNGWTDQRGNGIARESDKGEVTVQGRRYLSSDRVLDQLMALFKVMYDDR